MGGRRGATAPFVRPKRCAVGFAAAFVVAALAVPGVAAPAGRAAAAAAAAQEDLNRAVVVVDLGGGDVRSACVRFRTASVNALELLEAARMDPEIYRYSGQGGAVCSLCGKGCRAGSSCLTCQAPDYWQYWRSDGGTGSYTYSQAGGGNVQVTDGDVEGWRWGSDDAAPPYRSVDHVCETGPVYDYAPPTTTTAGPSPTTTAASPPTTSGPPPAPPPATSAPRPPRAATTTALPPAPAEPPPVAETSTSTTEPGFGTAGVDESDEGDGSTVVSGERPRVDGDDPGGSRWPGLVAFALLMTGIVGQTVRVRRAKMRASNSVR